jgi:hypothetical protein
MRMPKKKATKLAEIETSMIRRSPQHWTREYTQAKIDELCQQMEEEGLIQPIIVRKKKDGKGYEYLAGDRRFAAARKLGWPKISCLVRDVDDLDARSISISENFGREDLSTPVRDEALKELVRVKQQKLKRDQGDLPDPDRAKSTKGPPPNEAVQAAAKEAGVSTRTVMRALATDKLIKDAAAAYKNEQISKRQADLLARMSEEDQEVELQLMLNETQDQTEERLQLTKERPQKPLPPGDKGKHSVKPALRLYDRITVLSRELYEHAKTLRGDLTEETVLALKDLDHEDILKAHQAVSSLLDDIEVVAAWKPHRK